MSLVELLIATVPLMLIFATLFAFTTWLERKALARIQNRIGPNKVGIPCTRIGLFGLAGLDGQLCLSPRRSAHLPQIVALDFVPFSQNGDGRTGLASLKDHRKNIEAKIGVFLLSTSVRRFRQRRVDIDLPQGEKSFVEHGVPSADGYRVRR